MKTIYTGECISWSPRGFGFIKIDAGETYFLHIRDTLNRDVEPGMTVHFVLKEFQGKTVAKEVEL